MEIKLSRLEREFLAKEGIKTPEGEIEEEEAEILEEKVLEIEIMYAQGEGQEENNKAKIASEIYEKIWTEIEKEETR